MSVRNQPKIYEANRRSKGRHPLFCFISSIGIYYPLTDIVIVHIVYINESNPYTPLMSISHVQICYQLLQTHPSSHSLNPSIHPSATGEVPYTDILYENKLYTNNLYHDNMHTDKKGRSPRTTLLRVKGLPEDIIILAVSVC